MTAHQQTNDTTAAHTITTSDGTEIPVPEEYICPLTLDVMTEPLLSKEGHNYEREAILSWVADHGTSPLTREALRPSQLVRNRTLETKIRFFLKQRGVAEDAVLDKGNGGFADFVGYVMSEDEHKSLSMESMSLNSLSAAYQVPRPQLSSTVQNESSSNESRSQDHLAERRRQIADLIVGAMRELDEF